MMLDTKDLRDEAHAAESLSLGVYSRKRLTILTVHAGDDYNCYDPVDLMRSNKETR